MNKRNLLAVSLIAILICSCQSKAEKKYQELKDLTEQHIKDLDNAKTKEEAIKIRNEYKERIRFEAGKLTDEEKKELEKDITWEEKKEADKLNNEVDNAMDRARERFRNQ